MSVIYLSGHLAAKVINEVESGCRKATYYYSPKHVVKATAQRRPDRRAKSQTIIVTIGAPNYAERAFIKKAVKAGESFPLKIQRREWPANAKSKR
jgi:hypothetical protein